MNITANWWAACHEDAISIWDSNALKLQGNWKSSTGGDWISQRNQAGSIATINNFQKVRFLSSAFNVIASETLTASDNNSYGVVSCSSNFYTIVNYATTFEIRRYNNLGVYSGTNWVITGQYERNSGAVLSDQTFYWSNDDTILAWDLNTDTALADLVTLTGYRVSYIMATAEGNIAVIWINDVDNRPSRLTVYTPLGAVFAQADYQGADLIGLSKPLDWDNNILWTSRQEDSGLGRLVKYDYSAGDFGNILTLLDVPNALATNPSRSEFGFYPLLESNGETGGLYKLTPDLKHDESWTGDDSYVAVKKPDPFIKTALFGDEA